jgi:hypothetical protein
MASVKVSVPDKSLSHPSNTHVCVTFSRLVDAEMIPAQIQWHQYGAVMIARYSL